MRLTYDAPTAPQEGLKAEEEVHVWQHVSVKEILRQLGWFTSL